MKISRLIERNAALYPNSRYKFVNEVVTDEGIYLELPRFPQIEPKNQDAYFTVTAAEENRLDVISFRFYGTTQLYWVLAIANNIINPFKISAGTVLKIPALESIFGSSGVL